MERVERNWITYKELLLSRFLGTLEILKRNIRWDLDSYLIVYPPLFWSPGIVAPVTQCVCRPQRARSGLSTRRTTGWPPARWSSPMAPASAPTSTRTPAGSSSSLSTAPAREVSRSVLTPTPTPPNGDKPGREDGYNRPQLSTIAWNIVEYLAVN